MTLNLYLFTGSPIKINKTLPTPTVISGDRVEGNQDVTAPSFIISSASIPNFNYAYVPDLSRYYFITGVIWIADSLWRLNLQVDVLKTYESRINLLSGTIKYSSLGSTAIQDARLSMEGTVSNVTASGIITDNWYYVLKYWNVGQTRREPSVAFFPPAAFELFWNKFVNLTETEQVIVGDCVIELSIVHYLKQSAVYGLTGHDRISFRLAGKDKSASVTMIWGTGDILPADQMVYILDGFQNVHNLDSMQYDTGASWTDGYFWTGNAKWSFILPYAGMIDVTPCETGYANITYCALDVRYEPYENAYIVTPYINERLEPSASVTMPVRTTYPFPIDRALDNISGQRIATALGVAGSVATGVGMLAADNPAGLLPIISGIAGGVNSFQQLRIKENSSSVQYIGNNGGVPAYTGMPDPTKLYWVKRGAVPRPGYSDLWSAYGKPDGAFRALSTLSGYYQVGDINLTNMSTATASERDQIKSLLLSGVIA